MTSARQFLFLLVLTLGFKTISTAGDVNYRIAIRAEDTVLFEKLVSDELWKSMEMKQPFTTEVRKIDTEHADGTRKTTAYKAIVGGSTASIQAGENTVELTLQDSPMHTYKFNVKVKTASPDSKMASLDGTTLEVSVDAERFYTMLIIKHHGLKKDAEERAADFWTIFASNLKTLVETGKPLFPERGAPTEPKKTPPAAGQPK